MKRRVCGTFLALWVAGLPAYAANAERAAAIQKAIAAEKTVAAARLRYPNTAQFRDLRAYPIHGTHLIVVCGEVSGRSDFGRYGRYAQFIGAVRNGRADPDELEFYDPTLQTDYSVPQRCEMAAAGKTFYQPEP